MKITRKQLSKIISEALNEQSEAIKVEDLKLHFLRKDEVPTRPYRFVPITSEMLEDARNHPKKQSGYYRELAQKQDPPFKNYTIVMTTKNDPARVMLELEGEKAPPKKKDPNVIIGSSIHMVGSQINKRGKKMDDYVFYRNSPGINFAYPKNYEKEGKIPKGLRKMNYSQETLDSAYKYSPVGR